MQLKFTQALAGMRQAQQYCDANDQALGGLSARGARAGFDATTERLASFAKAQEAHAIQASGELQNERQLVRDLRRKYLRPMVRVARTKVPAAAQLSAVALPPIRSNSTKVAVDARAMLEAVTPFRQLFQEGGLAADFVEQAEAAITAVETAVGQKGHHQSQRIGNTQLILDEVGEVRLELGALDAHVRAALPEGSDLLPEWSRIVRTIRASLQQASRAATNDAGVVAAAGAPGSSSAREAAQAGSSVPAAPAPAA